MSKEHNSIPSKRDWALLGLGAAMCIQTVGESPTQSLKTVDISPPKPELVVHVNPTLEPAQIAKRIYCQDKGAYSDIKLNRGCDLLANDGKGLR